MTLAKPSTREREPNGRVSKGDDAPFRPAFPVIESKFTAPPLRSGMVQRQRLLTQLLDGGPAVVSLVAPPGYGKTTLLAQWAAAHRGPVSWITIDPSDNDASVLTSYLGASFNRVCPLTGDTAKSLSTSGRKILVSAVPRLVQELHRWTGQALIVLDDAHLLTDRMALDAISTIIDHLPEGFRMAVAGRHQPELPLARLAAHRQLVELGREELALDLTETSALLSAAGQNMSADEIGQLTARTEGWAVGVYLASAAMGRGRTDFGPVSNFSGADPHVAAYLRTEFEDELEADDMTFLTRSVVLAQVSAAAAEAVHCNSGRRSATPSPVPAQPARARAARRGTHVPLPQPAARFSRP